MTFFLKKKSNCIRVIQISIHSILLSFIYVHKQKKGYSNRWSLNLCLHFTFIYFHPIQVVKYSKTERVTKQYNIITFYHKHKLKLLTKFYPFSILFPISYISPNPQNHNIFPSPDSELPRKYQKFERRNFHIRSNLFYDFGDSFPHGQ